MKRTLKAAWAIIVASYNEFFNDRVLRLSAALAYYAIFSIGPLLFIVIYLASLAFGNKAVTGEVHRQLKDYIGPQAAETVQSMMLARRMSGNLVTTIIGIGSLAFGATGVFGELQDSLNTIWGVQAKPGRSVWNYLRTRFLSFAMILGLGFLLLISMVITTALQALVNAGANIIPLPDLLTSLATALVNFFVVTILFAMIFKVLPDARVAWREGLVGALVTAVLFTSGKYLLGVYLGQEGMASSYGAAGSVIVILLWVYYSSLILFIGAEFTKAFAKQTGTGIQPASYAEPLTAEARAEQGMPPHPHQPAPAFAREQEAPSVQVHIIERKKRSWAPLLAAIGVGILAGRIWRRRTKEA